MKKLEVKVILTNAEELEQLLENVKQATEELKNFTPRFEIEKGIERKE